MISKVIYDKEKGLINVCKRGSIDNKDRTMVGAYGCDICKRFIKIRIGKYVLCSGRWTKKDQNKIDEQNAYRKEKYGF